MNPDKFKLGALVRVVFFPAGYFDRTEMVGIVAEKTGAYLKFLGYIKPNFPGEEINSEGQEGWFGWDYLVPMGGEEKPGYPPVFIEVLEDSW
ncbi:MAG: hypothetical protein E6R04_05605 [Spirochaetes bacterium]|nr:MAG: hypothetical protein E6R04_05605 [Spirochaetota bacterium]